MSIRQLFDSLMAHSTCQGRELRALRNEIDGHRQETAFLAAKLDRQSDAMSYLAKSLHDAFTRQENTMSALLDAVSALDAKVGELKNGNDKLVTDVASIETLVTDGKDVPAALVALQAVHDGIAAEVTKLADLDANIVAVLAPPSV